MDDSFWIHTEPTIDGKAYIVTLSFNDDHSFALTPSRASAYTNALLASVADAEYDHAILRQVTEKLGLPQNVAMNLVADFRKERPPREAAGVVFTSGVSARTGEPFIQIGDFGQMGAGSARRHALHVLEAVVAADLDATYFKVLRSSVDLDETRARNVVADIGNLRQDWSVSDE